MNIKEIDEKNDLDLLKLDKVGLIRKLQDIENKLESISKENKYNYFKMERYTLKDSIENQPICVSISNNKFKFVENNFYDSNYSLNELLELNYNENLLKVLYEVYSNIEEIFSANLKVYQHIHLLIQVFLYV